MRPFTRQILSIAILSAAAVCTTGCLYDPVAREARQRQEAFDLLTAGQQLKQQGDFILARDKFLSALEVSRRPVLLYEIGNCHLHLGNPEQARDYYLQALDMAPDYTLAESELAVVEQQLVDSGIQPEPAGDGEEVKRVESRGTGSETTATDPAANAEDPEQASPEPEETQAAEDADEVADSAEEGEAPPPTEAESPFSGFTRAMAGISGQEQVQEKTAEDIDLQEARKVVFPELATGEQIIPEIERTAAEEAMALGRYDEAARRWARLISVAPDDVEARLSLAEALQRSGRTRRAEQELSEARRLADQDAEVSFQVGNFYVRLRRSELARDAFLRALELDPEHYRAMNNLGAVYLELDQAEIAIPYLEDVAEAQPTFAQAWLNLALAKDDAGADAEEVLAALENYRRLSDTTDPASEKWLRELRARVRSGE